MASGLRPLALGLGVWALAVGWLGAQGSGPIESSFFDGTAHPSIAYHVRPSDDPVARLGRQLEAGTATLGYERGSGYLRALLRALDIDVDTQLAVFSKTSLQAPFISPRNPRTIFFNDSVAVAWPRGGFVEIAAQDPVQGVALLHARPAGGRAAPPRPAAQLPHLPRVVCHPQRARAAGAQRGHGAGRPFTHLPGQRHARSPHAVRGAMGRLVRDRQRGTGAPPGQRHDCRCAPAGRGRNPGTLAARDDAGTVRRDRLSVAAQRRGRPPGVHPPDAHDEPADPCGVADARGARRSGARRRAHRRGGAGRGLRGLSAVRGRAAAAVAGERRLGLRRAVQRARPPRSEGPFAPPARSPDARAEVSVQLPDLLARLRRPARRSPRRDLRAPLGRAVRARIPLRATGACRPPTAPRSSRFCATRNPTSPRRSAGRRAGLQPRRAGPPIRFEK